MINNTNNSAQCESCAYYEYDEISECYCCTVAFDEDELSRFYSGGNYSCPYYNYYDEYKLVRKQN